jgi:hypothetical protein
VRIASSLEIRQPRDDPLRPQAVLTLDQVKRFPRNYPTTTSLSSAPAPPRKWFPHASGALAARWR